MIGRIARLYYEHGLTHQEIADIFGISRVKVTRLLQEARDRGIVEIRVHSQTSPFVDVEHALTERFGLRQAWVAPSPSDPDKAEASFSAFGAEALMSAIDADVTVAVSLSTAVSSVSKAMPTAPVPAIYVPVSGGWSGLSDGSSPAEIAMLLAQRTGGRSYRLPATLVAPDAHTARATLALPELAQVLDTAASASILLTGIGGTGENPGLLYDSLPAATRDTLTRGGAVGDLSGRYFNAAGELVASDLDDRVIGLRLDQMRAIPFRIAFARGQHKLSAMRAALKSHLVNAVVTDFDTAQSLLHEV